MPYWKLCCDVLLRASTARGRRRRVRSGRAMRMVAIEDFLDLQQVVLWKSVNSQREPSNCARTMDIDLKTLRLLVAVCDARNMKLAATQEHIEPSAISKRITQLEERLGARLLVRGRRGVHPTPAGVALLEHARTILFSLDRMEADVCAFAGGLKGHVRLVASASAIAEALLDDVAAFMRDPDHREINVDIEERVSRDIIRVVRDGGAGLGVCWDTVDFQGLEHRAYRRDQLMLAVHPAHALCRRRRMRFEESLAFEHVGLPPATAVHSMLQRAAGRAGQRINYRVIVTTFDAALRVVAAGLGVSVIPREVVRGHRDQVVLIPLSDPWAQRHFAICFRRFEDLQPSAARLLEFLASHGEATSHADGA